MDIGRLFDIARRRNCKIVLPEGDDARVLAAAARLHEQKIATPIVLGEREAVCRMARRQAPHSKVSTSSIRGPTRAGHRMGLNVQRRATR
jgi:phosphotransacetylase